MNSTAKCAFNPGKASLCIVSVLLWQHHVTGPCQNQVFDIFFRTERSVALIPEHTQGQQFTFTRNHKHKMFGFEKVGGNMRPSTVVPA